MKKALDYVSNYQLKSACKDAICIPPSKVTQMILAANIWCSYGKKNSVVTFWAILSCTDNHSKYTEKS